MKPILMAGSAIVTLALISYSIAFFSLHRRKRINPKSLSFQTAGLFLDITATTFMIIGSSQGAFTFHGLLGYSSLTLMIIDTLLIWRSRESETLPSGLKVFSKVAYIWWVLAYITGSLLVMLR